MAFGQRTETLRIPARDRPQPASRPARAKKSLGQHFLVDRRILGRIIHAAQLSPDDAVVEIGPGRGFLTRALANRVDRVVAVGIDGALADRLASQFGDRPNVEVIAADAREVIIDSLVAADVSYKVVANLPYYAATPIVRRFLEARHKPALMVVMLQREVAQEMAARPGKMGLLSLATQLYGKPHFSEATRPSWAGRFATARGPWESAPSCS